jgi:hypothetical protein
MNNPFYLFIRVVVALILGVIICKLFNISISNYLLYSLILVCIFIIVSYGILTDKILSTPLNTSVKNRNNKDRNNKEHYNNNLNNYNYKIPNLDVADGTFKDSTLDWYGRPVPIMGPLDGLNTKEMASRLQYLKQKTAYPYRPMTYSDFQTSSDKQIDADNTSLINKDVIKKNNKQEMERWYPDTTYLQMNARDCTNYNPEHPFSCIQKHPGLLTKDERAKEKFLSSMPARLTTKQPHPTIFKNAPTSTNNKDISKNICRGCTIGYCIKGVCGSTLLDDGDNNIISDSNYLSSYLEDGIF